MNQWLSVKLLTFYQRSKLELKQLPADLNFIRSKFSIVRQLPLFLTTILEFPIFLGSLLKISLLRSSSCSPPLIVKKVCRDELTERLFLLYFFFSERRGTYTDGRGGGEGGELGQIFENGELRYPHIFDGL